MSDTYRFTFSVTPLTEVEMQGVVDDIRTRLGRKPLIHIVGKQPSSTRLDEIVLDIDRDRPEITVDHPTLGTIRWDWDEARWASAEAGGLGE